MLVFDPGVIAVLLLAELLYGRAVHVLGNRGYRVPRLQQTSWHFGMALQAFALLGPFDARSGDLLWCHMSEHLILADIAVPFLLIGMRTPVLVFIPPRRVLVALARRKRLRTAFRTMRNPIAAIPIYLVILYGWHFSFAFEAALRDPAIHALQHISFIFAGVLVWWSALEPQRRRLRGELWKVPYIFASRMVSMFLGVGFVVSRHAFYSGYYGPGARAGGISPVLDQQIGGGIMMTADIIIIFAGLCFFFYRASADADIEQAREDRQAAAAAT